MRRFAAVLATMTTMALVPSLVSASADGASRGDPGAGGSHDLRPAAGRWAQHVPFEEQVVSSPTWGGGYPGAEELGEVRPAGRT